MQPAVIYQSSKCVLLADRHHSLIEGVRGLLETAFGTIFMVADETSLLDGVDRLTPSVTVVDLAFAGGEWMRLLRTLRERSPASKLIVLSLYDELSVARAAMAVGVDGFVLKRAIATDMLDAVAAVISGHSYISPGVSEVENALAAENALRDRDAILSANVIDNARALELVLIQYRVGNADLRAVEQRQLALYAAQTTTLHAQTERLARQPVPRVGRRLRRAGAAGGELMQYAVRIGSNASPSGNMNGAINPNPHWR
jgi:DNA-binding NarL/FixJ family response regulator